MSSDIQNDSGSHSRLEAQRRIDEICDQFEASWAKFLESKAERPLLTDYAEDFGSLDGLLPELLAVDIAYRIRLGEKPELENYADLDVDVELWRKATLEDSDSDVSSLFRIGPNAPAELSVLSSLSSDPHSSNNGNSNRANGDAKHDDEKHPQVGRYQIRTRVGSGGFGSVYLAYDQQLKRDVAIKIPHVHRFVTQRDVNAFLQEARIAAALDHEAIVPIYDFGKTEDNRCYVVSKWIQGESLRERLRDGRVGFAEAAEITARIADALHHAHKHRVSHRDVKPANILLEATTGRVFLTDFGLATSDEALTHRLGGTPAYMSPEQSRGESHLVDARSDVFSLGAVLYEMISGRVPYTSDSTDGTSTATSAAPPSNFSPNVPRQLEQICLKAISRRAVDRYQSASEFRNDLRHYVTHRDSYQREDKPLRASNRDLLSPKGFRSYSNEDADYFLSLLPGPFNREGLPQSIQFWKSRMEDDDPSNVFRVGVLYGPSGCGKSSFVKAGLIPQLAKHVDSVYLEASADMTSKTLERILRQKFPNRFHNDWSLVELCQAVRQHKLGQKTLVVFIDQFEQWLQSWNSSPGPRRELLDALRQADGIRLRFVLMVRDDFWLPLSRLMREVEVPISEGHNSQLLDLFDQDHAKYVLTEFGRAVGRLTRDGSLTEEEQRFIDRAIEDLQEDGRVVCVKLSLFTEIMKSRPWTLEELDRLGGPSGIGVVFLDSAFSSKLSPAKQRRHEQAARRVLSALLPVSTNTEIRGNRKSLDHLRRVTEYENREEDFDELIEVLDRDLRLISPSVSEASRNDGNTNSCEYQLTHDYLVPPVRAWLQTKETQTLRGRAKRLLEDRADIWSTIPETRNLPSLFEWLRLLFLTPSKNRRDHERNFLRAATKYYWWRIGLATAAVAILLFFAARWNSQRIANHLHKRLTDAEIGNVPGIIDEIENSGLGVKLALRNRLKLDDQHDAKRVALVLADRIEAREIIVHQLPLVPPDDFEVLCSRISEINEEQRNYLVDKFSPQKRRVTTSKQTAFQAGVALLKYAPEELDTNDEQRFLLTQLTAQDLLRLPQWWNNISSQPWFRSHLRNIFAQSNDQATQLTALRTSAFFAHKEATNTSKIDWLVEVLCDSPSKTFQEIFRELKPHEESAIPLLVAQVKETAPPWIPLKRKNQIARRRSNAAIALVRLGASSMVQDLFSDDRDPTARTDFVHRAKGLGVTKDQILELISQARGPDELYALLLCMGQYQDTHNASHVMAQTARKYLDHPNAGVQSASEWLLLKANAKGALETSANDSSRESRASASEHSEPNGWSISALGLKFSTIHVQSYVAGTPNSKPVELPDGVPRTVLGAEKQPPPNRFQADETQHYCIVDRTIAMQQTELSLANLEMLLSLPDLPTEFVPLIAQLEDRRSMNEETQEVPLLPYSIENWFEAASICNLASWAHGIPETQWCYNKNDDGAYAEGMSIPEDQFDRRGYRLPTEWEWEFAARGNTHTIRYFGNDERWLPSYAHYIANSVLPVSRTVHTQPGGKLIPNQFGLFDMLGGVTEATQSRADFHVPPKPDSLLTGPITDRNLSFRGTSYWDEARNVRTARRYADPPGVELRYSCGLRLVQRHPNME